MALNRPKVSVPSAASSAQFINSNQRFMNIKDGQTVVLRFMPAPDGAPSIFFPVTNHHGFKKEDGEGKAALACLNEHGVTETGRRCLICDVLNYLRETDPDTAKAVSKESAARARYYTQVLQASTGRNEAGKMVITGWSRPKLIQWSKTAQGDIQALIDTMDNLGEELFYDVDNGQGLYVSRTGSGFDTDYRFERTSVKESLDTIRPEWGGEFIGDIYKAVGLNIYTRDVQLQYMQRAYPKLDWDEILAGIGEEA